jgi:hypothetical protein
VLDERVQGQPLLVAVDATTAHAVVIASLAASAVVERRAA